MSIPGRSNRQGFCLKKSESFKWFWNPCTSEGKSDFRFRLWMITGVNMIILALTMVRTLNAGTVSNSEGIAFFENRIRPIFAKHCFPCHSDQMKPAKGGFRLDVPALILKGGGRGPAIVPGKAEESLLVRAIRHESLEMPPGKKLPQSVIAQVVQWVSMGAPVPVENKPREFPNRPAMIDHWWSVRPVGQPNPPLVDQESWPRTVLDRFILKGLESAGLSPAVRADKHSLIRRATYDLTGLPPTFDEAKSFLQDDSPYAFEKVIDRLLSSPRYGERWGRHWLDVARYADTKDGVLMFGDDRIRPYAYTYRDYVVRALNEDLPYDRFIHEQLAADLIRPQVAGWRLAAMGFLTLGRIFDNNIHDVIDDQIDTVSRGLLGLTVACARCHDHKYDPITTKDYYALYGVFASSEKPIELPVIDTSVQSPEARAFEDTLKPKREELKAFLNEQYALLSKDAAQRVEDYLVHVVTSEPDPLETAIYFLSLAPEDLRPPIVASWRRFLTRRIHVKDPVFGPWHDLMEWLQSPSSKGRQKITTVVDHWKMRDRGTNPGEVNPWVMDALVKTEINAPVDVARVYGKLFKKEGFETTSSCEEVTEEVYVRGRRQLAEIMHGSGSPHFFPKSRTRHYMSRKDKDAFSKMLRERDRLVVQSVHAPARAMVLEDAPQILDPRVFIRGNPGQPGEPVSRRFLEFLSTEYTPAFVKGSGRLELARAITHRSNPLTSRVMANRIWFYHFGEPLVQTPSDFGTRSNPPFHPELLEYLSWKLLESGWSLKALHRVIMRSAVYQQSSMDRVDCRAVDPDNHLFWRMNRRRLGFEAMRDSLLAMGGNLTLVEGGRPVDLVNNLDSTRRTIYGLVDRQSLPGMYRVFDFASPDQSVARRPFTTTPQQALFVMNSPLMMQQAQFLAQRSGKQYSSDFKDRIRWLYHTVFQRDVTEEELKQGIAFIEGFGNSSESSEPTGGTRWSQYVQVLLLTNEWMFVD